MRMFYDFDDAVEYLGYDSDAEEEENVETVYVDGSCIGNGVYDNASMGVGFWYGDGDPRTQGCKLIGASRSTNNIAELTAIEYAIRFALGTGIDRLVIYTDSRYCIDCFTKFLPKWVRNGFITCQGTPVVNKNRITLINNLMRRLRAEGVEIDLEYVPAHSGVYGNERANELAIKAARA